MAGETKKARSEKDTQSLAADLLRRATSPEVLAGVAGAAAAARFTKHLVEDSDESDETDEAPADEPSDSEEVEETEDPGEDEPADDEREEPSAEEEEPDDGEREEPSAEEEAEVPEATSDPESDEDDEPDPQDEDSDEERAASNGSPLADDDRMEVLDHARQYAEQLTGHPVESFSSLERDDRGWRIGVEVVELSRVPSTTDVLGSYELVLTDEGEFVDFRRDHRYSRNSTDDAS